MFSSFAGCVGLVVALVLIVWPLWRILTKMGYPGVASLLMYVPIVNFIALWYLALTDWPIELELQRRGGPPMRSGL